MATLDPTPGYLTWRLAMKWQAAVDREVAPYGLTHAQYSLLASLRGLTSTGARPSQRELSDFTGLDPIFVSKLIRVLETNGLVERAQHPSDTRAVALRLTRRGTQTIDRAIASVHDLLERLTAPLGGLESARTKQFKATLQQLLAHDQNPKENNHD
jgi:MarR family transcriptional regulator, organic hydroperoxide resistance regulator